MRERAGDLYAELERSQLLIFKGDMNYRKLVGDRDWPHNIAFQVNTRFVKYVKGTGIRLCVGFLKNVNFSKSFSFFAHSGILLNDDSVITQLLPSFTFNHLFSRPISDGSSRLSPGSAAGVAHFES